MTVTLGAIVSANNLLTTSQCFFGMSDGPGPILSAAGNYLGWFFAPSTSVNWCSYARATSTVSGPTSSGVVAAAAYVDLKLVITSTSVQYYANGTLVDTKTTAIPAGGVVMYPAVYISSNANTNAPTLYVDTFEMDWYGGLAGKFMKAAI